MKHASRVVLTAFVFALAFLIGGSAAWADGLRIAVLDVEGARNDRLRNTVAKIVDGKHEVLTSKSYRKAAKRAKARRMRPKDVRKVASMLAVDGVVEGMLVAEDRGYVLRLRLREGVTGKTVRKFTVFLKTPRLSGKLRRQLADRLLAAIGNLDPISGDADWTDEEEVRDDRRSRREERRAERRSRAEERRAERRRRAEERKQMRAERRRRAREEREERKERRRARDFIDDDDIDAARGDDDAEDEELRDDEELDEDFDEEFDDEEPRGDDDDDDDDDFDDDGGREDDRGAGSRAAPDPRTAAITVNAGGTVIGRTLQFTTRPDIAMPPSQYDGAYAPGVTMSGEFYPMAFGSEKDKGKAANIGFSFDVERSVGLASQIQTAEGMEPVKLPTQRQRYGIRALYRHNFGDKSKHPTATIGIGWSKMSFTIDKSQVPEGIVVDVPDVVYRYIDPGVKLRLPAGDKLAFITEARFMAITGAGPIVSPEQYGQATVMGVDGDVALEYRAAPKWLVRVGGHVNYIGYTFKVGAGELSSNRDGNLNDLDVGGAADRYLGGYISAGYIY